MRTLCLIQLWSFKYGEFSEWTDARFNDQIMIQIFRNCKNSNIIWNYEYIEEPKLGQNSSDTLYFLFTSSIIIILSPKWKDHLIQIIYFFVSFDELYMFFIIYGSYDLFIIFVPHMAIYKKTIHNSYIRKHIKKWVHVNVKYVNGKLVKID